MDELITLIRFDEQGRALESRLSDAPLDGWERAPEWFVVGMLAQREADGQILPVTPEEIQDAAPTPRVMAVSMRQARLALLDAGLLDQVEAAIAAMPGTAGQAAQIEWEYATEVKRDSPLLAGLVQALQLDEDMLDLLFLTAAEL